MYMRGLGLAAALVVAAGCALDYPEGYPRGVYTRRQLTGESDDRTFTPPPPISAKIDQLVGDAFPPPWTFAKSDLESPSAKRLHFGQQLFQKHCVHCHGVAGEGAGPTAPYLVPPPRDFRRGVFKWKSTARPAKPTRDDLVSILRYGALGTSMPPFGLLPDDQIEALVDYVVYLSQRGEMERQLLLVYASEGPTLEQIAAGGEPLTEDETREVLELLEDEAASAKKGILGQWSRADAAVVSPPDDLDVPPADSPEFRLSVERGRDLYLGSAAGCVKCHGPDGRADPEETKLDPRDVVDDWGQPNPPRNLTLGLFRGGRRPIDLYRRIHEGVAGSSMPGLGQNPLISKEQIWDLVNFLRALPVEPELLARPSPPTAAERVGGDALGESARRKSG
jgi:mono/diheme cytochrome c family protein